METELIFYFCKHFHFNTVKSLRFLVFFALFASVGIRNGYLYSIHDIASGRSDQCCLIGYNLNHYDKSIPFKRSLEYVLGSSEQRNYFFLFSLTKLCGTLVRVLILNLDISIISIWIVIESPRGGAAQSSPFFIRLFLKIDLTKKGIKLGVHADDVII